LTSAPKAGNFYLATVMLLDKSKAPDRETASGGSLTFRWRYIALPIAVLLITVVLSAFFYHLLPGETAYHFEDGLPDKWMGRGAIIAWTVIPQFIFVLLAGVVVWGMTKMSNRFQEVESSGITKMLYIMGNMVALPQLILGFAMLDIFSYNAYQVHLIPLWAFALIVMVLGAFVLGIIFTQAIRRIRTGQPRVKPGK